MNGPGSYTVIPARVSADSDISIFGCELCFRAISMKSSLHSLGRFVGSIKLLKVEGSSGC